MNANKTLSKKEGYKIAEKMIAMWFGENAVAKGLDKVTFINVIETCLCGKRVGNRNYNEDVNIYYHSRRMKFHIDINVNTRLCAEELEKMLFKEPLTENLKSFRFDIHIGASVSYDNYTQQMHDKNVELEKEMYEMFEKRGMSKDSPQLRIFVPAPPLKENTFEYEPLKQKLKEIDEEPERTGKIIEWE